MRLLRRSQSLTLLAAALAVAVAALAAVGFFADRVERSLSQQGAALQAADLVVQQGTPIPVAWREAAARMQLLTNQMIMFPSVLLYDDEPLLVQVKAVDDGYPLRGRLSVEQGQAITARGPRPGEVFVEPRLLQSLPAAAPGETISLGNRQLAIGGVIRNEPDRGGNLFQLAPRILVNYRDAIDSGLLGPASRVKHRLLLAGSETAITDFRNWLGDRLQPGTQLLGIEDARPELRTALQRAERFLGLAALCASLLAGVAILLTAKRYIEKAFDGVAVLRTLGMSGNAVMMLHLRELVTLGLIGSAAGVAAGYIGQAALAALIGDWFGDQLPAPGLTAWIPGFIYGLVLLLGFATPGLLRLRHVPPLRVLRHELGAPPTSAWISGIFAVTAVVTLTYWQAQDALLTTTVLLFLAGVLLALIATGWLLLAVLRPLASKGGGVGHGIRTLLQQRSLALWQLGGFGLGISLLLLLSIVRVDLIDTWQASLPQNAPNHFLINIQPDELPGVERWLADNRIDNTGFFATTRARLLQINGTDIDPQDYTDSRARRLATREYSLGFSDIMQPDNRLLAGQNTLDTSAGGFSIEQGLADTLGLDVGDSLTFDVAGQSLHARIDSIRSVAWDSFNVNFFVQGGTTLASGIPVSYLTSIHLDDPPPALTAELVRRHPSVSVLDLRPLLQQVRDIMNKGAHAVEAVFLFTLAAAALVTLAAVQINREQRAGDFAILRALGASRRYLQRSVLAEFCTLGLLAGLSAALLSAAAGSMLAYRLFELQPAFNPWLWIAGPTGGLLALGSVGWLATRKVTRTPPLQVLRSSDRA